MKRIIRIERNETRQMHFKIFTEEDKRVYEAKMIEILTASDDDFVPPLSKRNSTLDKSFSSTAISDNGVASYYNEMKKQEIVGAFLQEELLGFVSYRLDHVSDEIADAELPNIYVSTLVLSESARGKGITKKMYSYLFSELYPERNVFTRTWSTNFAHIKILSYFGFSEMLRKENDRGEGIDTVYFKRNREKIPVLL